MNEIIPSNDRNLAVFAHLSGLAGYVVPGLGIAVPIAIMFAFSDNRPIGLIAKQALLLNVFVFLCSIPVIVLAITIILLPVSYLLGLVLTTIAVLLPIIGALKAWQGELYRYPLVGQLT